MQVVALGLGVVWALLVLLTSDGGDLWSSAWWLWAWVGLPLLAAVLGRQRGGPPWLIAAALCAPMVAAFVVQDVVDADGGPVEWPIGAALVLALGAVCTVAARSGRRQAA